MLSVLSACFLAAAPVADDGDLLSRVEHGFADSDGVKIHYVSAGEGDLVVMLHGFPDYWYTWRHQMEVLSDDFQVVALDLRGYNKSDKPKGRENYTMAKLVGDVLAVVRHLGRERATIVGHDWGAAIAWQVAMQAQDLVERLVILSVPHPAGFGREMANNEAQQRDSQYARNFQKEGAHKLLSAEGLARWVSDQDARKHYVEAFKRSDFEAMLNYYKASYPKISGTAKDGGDAKAPATPQPAPSFPKIKAPVLVIHGVNDTALHAEGHNNTWDWVEKPTTILMIPNAGHFVQHDAAELVTNTMYDWLIR